MMVYSNRPIGADLPHKGTAASARRERAGRHGYLAIGYPARLSWKSIVIVEHDHVGPQQILEAAE